MMRVQYNQGSRSLIREYEIKRKIDQLEISNQIETLSTFLSNEVLNMRALGPIAPNEIQSWTGVLLFVDVKGVGDMCDKFTTTGKGGVYQLSADLNCYIGAIVEIISLFGGDVLLFAGASMLASWKAASNMNMHTTIHEVVVCALAIQENIAALDNDIGAELAVNLTISCGNSDLIVVGEGDSKHCILSGEALTNGAEARQFARYGELILAANTWTHLIPDNYNIEYIQNGHIRLYECIYRDEENEMQEVYENRCNEAGDLCRKHIKYKNDIHGKYVNYGELAENLLSTLPPRTSIKNASEFWNISELCTYIVRPVQHQLFQKQPIEYLIELRQITVEFITLFPTTHSGRQYLITMNNSFNAIHQIVSRLGGVICKVSYLDRNPSIMVLFGVDEGGDSGMESKDALKAAQKIRLAMSDVAHLDGVSIGISRGMVYCGVIGHPLRRDYAILGDVLDKAVALCTGGRNTVQCDHETFKTSRLPSFHFQRPVKGGEPAAAAGHQFEYREHVRDKPTFLDVNAVNLVGRQYEKELIRMIVERPNSTYRAIFFRGPPMIGKSALIRTAFMKYWTQQYVICSIDLIKFLQPYGAVCAIYTQLYDNLASINSSKLGNLPRDLWDLNKVIKIKLFNDGGGDGSQDQLQDDISSIFFQMCSERTLIFIDNLENIDRNSLEILKNALGSGHLRLICAGQENQQFFGDHIKCWDLKPFDTNLVVKLTCNIMHVNVVNVDLANLLTSVSHGLPGNILSTLETLKAEEEIEIRYTPPSSSDCRASPSTTTDDHSVLVVRLSKRYSKRKAQFTLAEVNAYFFESFTIYEKSIMNYAAIIGEICPRALLICLLDYPDKKQFKTAITGLFEKGAFCCASKYINSCGRFDSNLACQCWVADTDADSDFPKYASCQLIYFKNKTLRDYSYGSCDWRHVHLQITDLLESHHDNCCTICAYDKTKALLTSTPFRKFLQYCTSDMENSPPAAREDGDGGDGCNVAGKEVLSMEVLRRKAWEPTVCFCLEIQMQMYAKLIHHSERAGHLAKQLFFMCQFAVLYLTLNDTFEAILLLNHASELTWTDSNLLVDDFKTIMIGKIHMILSEVYYRLGEMDHAKNHLLISLNQYNVSAISFNYSFATTFMMRRFLTRRKRHLFPPKLRNLMVCSDFGICMSLVSNIFASEGQWQLAQAAASRSLDCLRLCNPNLIVLCDTYADIVDLYCYCGKLEICNKLGKSIMQEFMSTYTHLSTLELYILSKLIGGFFQTQLLSGKFSEALNLGYKALQLNMSIKAYYLQIEIITNLTYLLIRMKRIGESVHLGRILQDIAVNYDRKGNVAYYTFCLELILDSNFFLEPIEKIETFIQEYFLISRRKVESHIERKLLLLINIYTLRYPKQLKLKRFLVKEDNNNNNCSLTATSNLFRQTEAAILELVRMIDKTKSFNQSELMRIEGYLKRCESAGNKWILFKSRYLHYKAYFSRVTNHKRRTRKLLQRAHDEARKQGNFLEMAWTTAHMSYWNEGGTLGQNRFINWQLAESYNHLQWSQILYPLPYF